MPKVLILIGGRHFNAPSMCSQIYISTDGLVFLRGGCHFGNSLFASKTQLFNL